MRLTEDELVLYQDIENNRKLERIVREMRGLSSRVPHRPHNRPGGPMNPRVLGSSSAVTATAILQTLRPAH